jgi:hypothetical protein
MGGPTVKQRFYIIVIVFVLALIIGAVALSSQPQSARAVKVSNQITITIQNNIGIERITITNLNTGQIYKATLIDLPFIFNCTRGDYLRLEETTQPGYEWNAWWFNAVGRYDNANPLTIDSNDARYCVDNRILITPKCLILNPTSAPPTVTPQPTPTQSPSFIT